MVARKIIFTALICLLASCTPKTEIQYIDKPVYVEIPVVQKLEIEPVKKPVNYLTKITKKSTPKEIAEAYVNTIIQQRLYIKQLEDIIEPFYIRTDNGNKR